MLHPTLKEDYYALVGIIAGLIFCVGLASCPPSKPYAWTRIDLRKHMCGSHPPGPVSARTARTSCSQRQWRIRMKTRPRVSTSTVCTHV